MSKLWMRTSVAVFAMATLAILHLIGCKGSSGSKNFVQVRLVHTATDLGEVDVWTRDGINMLSGIAYNEASGSASLKPGTYIIDVFTAGSDPTSSTPLVSVGPVELSFGQNRLTLVLAGLAGSTSADDRLRLVSLTEDFAPNAFPLARVRFINATADAPTLFLDTDDDGDPESAALTRFAATPAAGENLPVFDLNLALLTGDPLMRIDGYQFRNLNRSDQYLFITTGLLSENRSSPFAFQILLVGNNGTVDVVQPNPDLYFLNASTDTSPISLNVDGDPTFVDAPYGTLQGPMQITPGSHAFAAAGAAAFANSTASLDEGGTYLLVAAGVGGGGAGELAQLVLLKDEFEMDAENARFRFLNVSPDNPTIDFGTTTGGMFDDPIVYAETAFAESTAGVGDVFAPDMYDFGAGTPGTPNPTEIFTVSLTAGDRDFVLLIGLLGGGAQPPQILQIMTDSDPWTPMTIDAN